MKYHSEVVIWLALCGSWGSMAYSESAVGNIENIGCTSRQKMDKLSAQFKDIKVSNLDVYFLSGCTLIENSRSIFIEKASSPHKIIVFFGEDRIELFVDERFNVIR